MNQIPPEYLNHIVTGDARDLAKRLPDESVNVIFTDPPYPRDYLYLYEWLSEIAARVLTPGGLCLAMCGGSWLPEIYAAMGKHLTYHWTFCVKYLQRNTNVWPRHVATGWKPILSYSKGQYTGRFFGTDTLIAGATDKRFHRWGQDESQAAYFVEALDGVFFDPFCGGGTLPAVCKMIGKPYVAFELDPDAAQIARRRELDCSPLFVLPAQQMELLDSDAES